jgi:hypothetical protein
MIIALVDISRIRCSAQSMFRKAQTKAWIIIRKSNSPVSHMKTYDLHQFAANGTVPIGWHRFEAADDEAALDIAQALAILPPMELWEDGILIKRWEQDR